jgi:hypothetical protein
LGEFDGGALGALVGALLSLGRSHGEFAGALVSGLWVFGGALVCGFCGALVCGLCGALVCGFCGALV